MPGSPRWMRLFPNYFLLMVFLLIVLLPIIGITLSAFKTDAEIISVFGYLRIDESGNIKTSKNIIMLKIRSVIP